MRRYGTEGAASEASAMYVHRVFDHLIGRNGLAPILGMGQTGIRQVERSVQFSRRHRRVGRVHHHKLPVNALQKPLRVHLVRFLFYVPEVLSLGLLAGQTFLVSVQHDVVAPHTPWNIVLPYQKRRLRNVVYLAQRSALVHLTT